jgi:ferrous iron transport protein A
MEKKLSEMKYEEEGIVTEIRGGLKDKVAGLGIREGKEIKMMTKQPIKGPVVVAVNKANTSIGFGLANKIIVEVGK